MRRPDLNGWQAVLVAVVWLTSVPRGVGAADLPTYIDWSADAIRTLNGEFYKRETGIYDDAWWNSANAITTLADFALVSVAKDNELNIGSFLYNTYVQAQKTQVKTVKAMRNGVVTSTYCLDSRGGCMAKRAFIDKRGFDDFINDFYDDEGWWALAWIRAYDVSRNATYIGASVDIFKDMQTGLGGPCHGGIFWNKDRKYVNAISNELYLAVAASLALRMPEQRDKYIEIARDQWNLFDRSGMINGQGLINDGLDGNCKNNGLQTWSYNQGIILGGLVELALATGDSRYMDRAVSIARADIRTLSNKQGILEEVDKCELRPSNCGKDGQQFKGIFIRNLAYLHKRRPLSEFREFILHNANSIWEHDRDGANQLGHSWAGSYVKATEATGPTPSSALDALVAAASVLTA